MIAIIDGVEAARWAWILAGLATEQAANHYADWFVSRLRQRPQSLDPLKEYVLARSRLAGGYAHALRRHLRRGHAGCHGGHRGPAGRPGDAVQDTTGATAPGHTAQEAQRWEQRQWDDDEERQPDPKGPQKRKGKKGGKGGQPKRQRQEEQWQRWDYNQSEWRQNWQNRPREEWRGHEKDSAKESKQRDRR